MTQDDHAVRYPLPYEGALEPPPAWDRLRRECPVATVRLPSGDEAKLLTRYQDVKAMLADPRFARPAAGDDSARVAPEGSGGAVAAGDSSSAVPDKGEPHRSWRRSVSKWFTVRRMTALRPSMTEIAGRLVDDMVAGGAPADLRACVGYPLPVYVICTMLGVPVADRDRFSHWSDAMLSTTRFTREETRRAHAEFLAYMDGLIAAKRADPAEDLLSMLIAESEEGNGLSDRDLRATGLALLVAGHETTANMIGKMAAMLLSDRTRWERLLSEPSLVRGAVEESLRYDTNLGFGLRRYVGEEAEVGGEVLPGGTTVICSMPAANRDGEAFEAPDEMDLTRTPNPHLAFGVGPHSCLGQALARTELQVVLETLLRRLPTLELAVPAGELRRVEGLLVGGLREVPVRW